MLTFMFKILSQDGWKPPSIWRQQEQVSMRTSRNNLYKRKRKYSKFSFYCSINTNFNNWTHIDMSRWQNEMSRGLPDIFRLGSWWECFQGFHFYDRESGSLTGQMLFVSITIFTTITKTGMTILFVILHSLNSSSYPGVGGRGRRGGWSQW